MLKFRNGIHVYGELRSEFVNHTLTETGLGCLEINLNNGVNNIPTILKIECLNYTKSVIFLSLRKSMLRSACDKINRRWKSSRQTMQEFARIALMYCNEPPLASPLVFPSLLYKRSGARRFWGGSQILWGKLLLGAQCNGAVNKLNKHFYNVL